MSAADPKIAPYGAWHSRLDADDVVGSEVELRALVADGDDVYWLESVPAEDGRFTIMRLRDGVTAEVTPAPQNVRSRVNEYGGGAFHVRSGVIAWCDDTDGVVNLQTPDGTVRALTPLGSELRYGDLRVHPELPAVLAVREDHRGDDEPITSIVALPFPTSAEPPQDPTDQMLCAGADFYASPELNGDGDLAWVEWNHPDMPWDATGLYVGRLRSEGFLTVRDPRLVAGGPGKKVSVQHPKWSTRGLLFMADDTGYWNLKLLADGQVRALHDDPYDLDLGLWVLGNDSYAQLDDDTVLCWFLADGLCNLASLDLDDGELTRIGGVAGVESIAADNGRGHALLKWPNQPPTLNVVSEAGIAATLRAAAWSPDPAYTSIARSLTFVGRHGQVQAWYYPPTNAHFAAPRGQRPPLIVKTHGGPTSFATNAYRADTQFWTTRGFAYLDVNYSGSAGFGRAYRERLRGQWGVADVDDCIDAVQAALDAGLADPGKVAIIGGSAGGYTTLQALVVGDVFSAGVSSYGIGDLALLAQDTHKFEKHYTDGLVGPWPAAKDLYEERSPVHHVDQITSAMLILQGADDRVVPPNQAASMAHAVRNQGLPVALIVFEGEGHGFRKADSKRRVLDAMQSFFAQLFGYQPADDVPELVIDNLGTPDEAPLG